MLSSYLSHLALNISTFHTNYPSPYFVMNLKCTFLFWLGWATRKTSGEQLDDGNIFKNASNAAAKLTESDSDQLEQSQIVRKRELYISCHFSVLIVSFPFWTIAAGNVVNLISGNIEKSRLTWLGSLTYLIWKWMLINLTKKVN